MAAPLAALLARHVLSDGEVVLLILRPSRWFIALSCLRFLTVIAGILLLGAFYEPLPVAMLRQCLGAAAFLAAARLMWAILQWMSRLYVLTDQRILTLAGVFNVEAFECPLRRVARTFLDSPLRERVCRTGTVVIVPADDHLPLGAWRTVAEPREVLRTIREAIAHARR
jgi:hypothetical protein